MPAVAEEGWTWSREDAGWWSSSPKDEDDEEDVKRYRTQRSRKKKRKPRTRRSRSAWSGPPSMPLGRRSRHASRRSASKARNRLAHALNGNGLARDGVLAVRGGADALSVAVSAGAAIWQAVRWTEFGVVAAERLALPVYDVVETISEEAVEFVSVAAYWARWCVRIAIMYMALRAVWWARSQWAGPTAKQRLASAGQTPEGNLPALQTVPESGSRGIVPTAADIATLFPKHLKTGGRTGRPRSEIRCLAPEKLSRSIRHFHESMIMTSDAAELKEVVHKAGSWCSVYEVKSQAKPGITYRVELRCSGLSSESTLADILMSCTCKDHQASGLGCKHQGVVLVRWHEEGVPEPRPGYRPGMTSLPTPQRGQLPKWDMRLEQYQCTVPGGPSVRGHDALHGAKKTTRSLQRPSAAKSECTVERAAGPGWARALQQWTCGDRERPKSDAGVRRSRSVGFASATSKSSETQGEAPPRPAGRGESSRSTAGAEVAEPSSGMGKVVSVMTAIGTQDRVVELLSGATRGQTAVMTAYTFDRTDIAQAMIHAAKKGVKTTLIVDLKQTLNGSTRNQPALVKQLDAEGVAVYVARGHLLQEHYAAAGRAGGGSGFGTLMGIQHSKMFKLDDTVVLGSTNWTTSSRCNREISLEWKMNAVGLQAIEVILQEALEAGRRLKDGEAEEAAARNGRARSCSPPADLTGG